MAFKEKKIHRSSFLIQQSLSFFAYEFQALTICVPIELHVAKITVLPNVMSHTQGRITTATQ